jgi:hypothetical protein
VGIALVIGYTMRVTALYRGWEEPLAKEPTGVYKHDDGRPLLGRKLKGKSVREMESLGLGTGHGSPPGEPTPKGGPEVRWYAGDQRSGSHAPWRKVLTALRRVMLRILMIMVTCRGGSPGASPRSMRQGEDVHPVGR